MEDHYAIRARDLSMSYVSNSGVHRAFESVTFDVSQGEFVSILGPSGCGKTTLLRVLARLEQHTTGSLEIVQAAGTGPRHSLVSTTVFQEDSTLPWMSVEKNIGYGLRMSGVPRQKARATARDWLARVHLQEFAKAYPHQLSGGMKQRVTLARAMALETPVLFMDEPFGALDEQLRMRLQDELTDICSATGKTVVFVTHSIDEAIVLSDRIFVMSGCPGTIATRVDVDLPRPRRPLMVSHDDSYRQVAKQLHTSLSGAAT